MLSLRELRKTFFPNQLTKAFSDVGRKEKQTFPICYETLFLFCSRLLLLLLSFHNTIHGDPQADLFFLFSWREKNFCSSTKRMMNKFTRSNSVENVMDVKMREWKRESALKGHGKGSAGNWELKIRLTLIWARRSARRTQVRSSFYSIIPFLELNMCATTKATVNLELKLKMKSFVIL